jgi:hypothetical protein
MHYQLTMAVALATLVSAAAPVAITGDVPVQETQAVPAVRELSQMAARFVPTEIAADIRALPASERQALAKLVDAARLMDSLFLRQVWAGNDALLQQLARDTVRQAGTGAAGANMEQLALPATQLHYFLINKGPWSRLDHNRVFIAGVPAKPEGASFYPAGASKEGSRSGSTRCRVTRRDRPRDSSQSSDGRRTAASPRYPTRSSTKASSRVLPVSCARQPASRTSPR